MVSGPYKHYYLGEIVLESAKRQFGVVYWVSNEHLNIFQGTSREYKEAGTDFFAVKSLGSEPLCIFFHSGDVFHLCICGEFLRRMEEVLGKGPKSTINIQKTLGF